MSAARDVSRDSSTSSGPSLYILTIAWAIGAILYDGPAQRGSGNVAIAIVWTIVTLTFLGAARTPGKRFLVWLAAMAVVLIPWLLLEPSNHRDWKPQWARTGWAEIEGDTVTFHNFRNFDHTLDGDVTERWEKRTVHLSNLQGLDYFHHEINGDLLAHPVFSFDFGEDGRVALTIEARREAEEEFTPVGGLYRMFELTYVFGDERDFIRERANVRNQPVRLYRGKFDKERVLSTFLESVESLNDLRERPRFYNILSANCTNSIWAQSPVERRARFDHRMVFNGQFEALLYERGALITRDFSLEDLKEQASINKSAKAAHDAPDFSAKIREGLPGFE